MVEACALSRLVHCVLFKRLIIIGSVCMVWQVLGGCKVALALDGN